MEAVSGVGWGAGRLSFRFGAFGRGRERQKRPSGALEPAIRTGLAPPQHLGLAFFPAACSDIATQPTGTRDAPIWSSFVHSNTFLEADSIGYSHMVL